MDDLEFIRKCIGGDKQSWDEFIDKYSRLIYNYINSVLKQKNPGLLTKENTGDIFHEIFLSLTKDNFKKLSSFKGKNGCTLASWLRVVTVNYTLDYLRKFKPAVSLEEEGDDGLILKDIIADSVASVIDTADAEERLTHLKECIDELGTDDKYFLELHINRGVCLEAMKGLFGVSRPAIDMRKLRIIQRLRECFKSNGFVA